MDIISIGAIAAGLAMDAFSVSIAAGMVLEKPGLRHYFRLSFHFGFFQFMMPVAGYFIGIFVEALVRVYAHWFVMILLSLIGIKMIRESYSKTGRVFTRDPSRGLFLIFLSIATSIDALAVGIGLGILGKPILFPSIIIGLVCSAFSITGIYIGKKAGSFFGKRVEMFGGLILIIIGIKIVIEHYVQ